MSDMASKFDIREAELECSITRLELHTYLEFVKDQISDMEDDYNSIYTEGFFSNKKDNKSIEQGYDDVEEMISEISNNVDQNKEEIKSNPQLKEYISKATAEEKRKGLRESDEAIRRIKKVLNDNIKENERLQAASVRDAEGNIKPEVVDQYIKNNAQRGKEVTSIINQLSSMAAAMFGAACGEIDNQGTKEKISKSLKQNKKNAQKIKNLKKNDKEAYKKLSLDKKLAAKSIMLDKQVIDSVYKQVDAIASSVDSGKYNGIEYYEKKHKKHK